MVVLCNTEELESDKSIEYSEEFNPFDFPPSPPMFLPSLNPFDFPPSPPEYIPPYSTPLQPSSSSSVKYVCKAKNRRYRPPVRIAISLGDIFQTKEMKIKDAAKHLKARQERLDEGFDNDEVEAVGIGGEGTKEGEIAEAQLNSGGFGKWKTKEKTPKGERGNKTPGGESSNNKISGVSIAIPLEDISETEGMLIEDATNHLDGQQEFPWEDFGLVFDDVEFTVGIWGWGTDEGEMEEGQLNSGCLGNGKGKENNPGGEGGNEIMSLAATSLNAVDATIAQAMEEQVASQLCSIAPDNSSSERQLQNLQSDVLLTNDSTDGQHSEGQHHVNGAEASHHEADQMVESVPHQEESDPQVFEANDCPQEREPMLSDTLTENDAMNGHDNMEIGDANGTVNGQDLGRDGSSATNSQSITHALPTSGFEISNPSDCLELTRQEQLDEDFDNDKVEAAGVEGTEKGKIAEAQLNSKGFGKQKAKEKIPGGEKGSRTQGRERSNNKTRTVRIPIPSEDTLQTKKMRLGDAANHLGAQQEQLDEDSDNDRVEPEEGEIVKTRGVRIVIPLENILKVKEMQRKDAANHLGVSISTLKRICRDYGILRWPPRDVDKLNNQSHPNEPPAVTDDRERIPHLNSDVLPCNQVSTIDTNRVTVMAKYKGSRIKFQLSLPWRKVELEQEVKKRLPLEAGTYFINYKDVDGEMTLIACDEDLEGYISSSSPLSTRLIELFLEPM